MSFTEKLDPEALAYFNNVAQKPFSQQAVAFLNAYWPEVHDQAEFIFTYVRSFRSQYARLSFVCPSERAIECCVSLDLRIWAATLELPHYFLFGNTRVFRFTRYSV
jgi:hypothetical protein